MSVTNKIGVGVITCNRIHFFKQCIASIEGADVLVVVNDGVPYPDETYTNSVDQLIQHKTNKSVGVSKNDALKYLIEKGCKHLFLIEDDMEIIDNEVFNQYIKAAEVTGIKHFNYAMHGPFNKDELGNKVSKFVVNYEEGISISLHEGCVGSFSYYDKQVIDAVGYMDERFKNCWEHVEHSYRMILKGFLPGMGWWPDLEDSERYIWDLDQDLSGSEIRKGKDQYKEVLESNTEIFKEMYGVTPGEIEQKSLGEVLKNLETIKELYSVHNS